MTTLPNGVTLRLADAHERLWAKMLTHYAGSHPDMWKCPWCGGEIDAVCDERDGGLFEDTWRCVGDCNLLITHITPAEYKEYHEVGLSEWTVLIEGGHGTGWYAPDEADDPIGDVDAFYGEG